MCIRDRARGDDGPHVFKPAPVQPADCLADRLLRLSLIHILRCFVMGWRGFFSFCFFKTAPPPLRWPALPARRPGPERPDTDRRRCGRSSMSALPISPFLLDSFWFFCVDIPAKSRIDYNAPAFSPQPPHIIFNGLLTPQNVGFLRNTRSVSYTHLDVYKRQVPDKSKS